jgi:uncharacterized protein YggE
VIVSMVAVAAIAVAIAATAAAGESTPAPSRPGKIITVTSTATVDSTPDEALFDLSVRSQDPDSAAAFAQNATDMKAVLAALKKAGVAGDDIRTLNVNLDQHTENRGQPNEQTFFVASNQVEVTVHDLSKVGDVLDAAVQAGADSVNDIRFQLSDQTKARTDALAQAVKGARAKADAIAGAAGANVSGLMSVTEESSSSPSYRSPFVFNQFAAAGDALSTPVVPPDSLKTSVTITVVWSVA